MRVEWRVEIKHDGVWPTKWDWKVVRERSDLRIGSAFTKKAKRSMEDEDVRVVYSDDAVTSALTRRADVSAERTA